MFWCFLLITGYVYYDIYSIYSHVGVLNKLWTFEHLIVGLSQHRCACNHQIPHTHNKQKLTPRPILPHDRHNLTYERNDLKLDYALLVVDTSLTKLTFCRQWQANGARSDPWLWQQNSNKTAEQIVGIDLEETCLTLTLPALTLNPRATVTGKLSWMDWCNYA
jgi:hypothetical protein